MEKRYVVWLCEGKLEVKIARFRLPSASQKRACLSSLVLANVQLTSEERKLRFIYVSVNVAIFNMRSRKAIPVESTVNTVRIQQIEIQLESENFLCFWFRKRRQWF